MYTLVGLNLLCLLSQSRLSEFHSELEELDPELLSSNIYIKHPIQVEQCLMEGSYNKIYQARQNVPAQEYLFFMEILMDTIRNDIAACCESAYEALPIPDAATLLYLKGQEEVMKFAQVRGWKLVANRFVFEKKQQDGSVDLEAMMTQTLKYAHELEKIV